MTQHAPSPSPTSHRRISGLAGCAVIALTLGAVAQGPALATPTAAPGDERLAAALPKTLKVFGGGSAEGQADYDILTESADFFCGKDDPVDRDHAYGLKYEASYDQPATFLRAAGFATPAAAKAFLAKVAAANACGTYHDKPDSSVTKLKVSRPKAGELVIELRYVNAPKFDATKVEKVAYVHFVQVANTVGTAMLYYYDSDGGLVLPGAARRYVDKQIPRLVKGLRKVAG